MGGGDQASVRSLRHEAAQDRAAGFHQFRRDDDIDVARRRHQCQHRLAAVQVLFGKQLDIVDGRTGALRDAGHRGRLREIAIALRQSDEPVGQHATALAAKRQDRDRDALRGPSKGLPRRAALARRWKKPITRARSHAPNRSQRVGLKTICAL